MRRASMRRQERELRATVERGDGSLTAEQARELAADLHDAARMCSASVEAARDGPADNRDAAELAVTVARAYGEHGPARGLVVAVLLGEVAEVTRLCTDGAPNACSALYAAARKAAAALGFRRLITYTLPDEGGGSLRASGFKLDGHAGGGSWSRRGRARVDQHPTARKLRWSAPLAA